MAAPPSAAGALPPADLLVRLAPDVRVRDGGRLLVGGAPFRLLRLSRSGAAVVARWRAAPTAIGRHDGARTLARNLIDTAMLDAAPAPVWNPADVGIVVPVKDRPAQLDRCLRAIAATVTGVPITIVDDGSADAAAIARVAAEHGADLVRHDTNLGAAGARNRGLASMSTRLVAFVDSDVVVGPDLTWLAILVAQFADPRVGAAAPRVLALDGSTRILAGYERRRSSLDMGARGGIVAPGRWTSYVPSATLVVRRDAVPDGGFDTSLRVGEDVDFVWRMSRDGWLVAYDPRATVRHDHRLAPAAFVARRRDYAMSIALLGRRHPEAVPALRADPTSLALVALLAAGRPRSALAAFALRTLRLRRRLHGHTAQPARLSLELAGAAALGTARGAGHAVRRTWSPLVLALALWRPRALALLAAAELLSLFDLRGPRHPADLVLGAADDLLAGIGTWEGCLRHRTVHALLPAIGRRRQPPTNGATTSIPSEPQVASGGSGAGTLTRPLRPCPDIRTADWNTDRAADTVARGPWPGDGGTLVERFPRTSGA